MNAILLLSRARVKGRGEEVLMAVFMAILATLVLVDVAAILAGSDTRDGRDWSLR